MSNSKSLLIGWAGCCLGLAVWMLWNDGGEETSRISPGLRDEVAYSHQLAERHLSLPPGEETPEYVPVQPANEVLQAVDLEQLDEGLMRLESGEVVFTKERAIQEASRVLLDVHMPKPETFVRSYTAWPEGLTQETSAELLGRELTSLEIADVQAIHDEYLPDLLAYASLMRADYSEILRTVESTRSYKLEPLDPAAKKPRSPQNHNVVTMPGWRVTYPVGYDTYPHLLETSEAAHDLRKSRDRAVAVYLASSK